MHSEYKTPHRKKEIGFEEKLLKSKFYCPYKPKRNKS